MASAGDQAQAKAHGLKDGAKEMPECVPQQAHAQQGASGAASQTQEKASDGMQAARDKAQHAKEKTVTALQQAGEKMKEAVQAVKGTVTGGGGNNQ